MDSEQKTSFWDPGVSLSLSHVPAPWEKRGDIWVLLLFHFSDSSTEAQSPSDWPLIGPELSSPPTSFRAPFFFFLTPLPHTMLDMPPYLTPTSARRPGLLFVVSDSESACTICNLRDPQEGLQTQPGFTGLWTPGLSPKGWVFWNMPNLSIEWPLSPVTPSTSTHLSRPESNPSPPQAGRLQYTERSTVSTSLPPASAFYGDHPAAV